MPKSQTNRILGIKMTFWRKISETTHKAWRFWLNLKISKKFRLLTDGTNHHHHFPHRSAFRMCIFSYRSESTVVLQRFVVGFVTPPQSKTAASFLQHLSFDVVKDDCVFVILSKWTVHNACQIVTAQVDPLKIFFVGLWLVMYMYPGLAITPDPEIGRIIQGWLQVRSEPSA